MVVDTRPVFLKLGGSLITNKDRPHTARRRLIRRLAVEIRHALDDNPTLSLVLGHGSGSFGHVPAARYGTRRGVRTPEEWRGFVEVWQEARALNQIVIEECLAAGLPVVAFPPSATIDSVNSVGNNLALPLIESALEARLIPIVYGDVVFDRKLGGTIFSTEEVFILLAKKLEPYQILLAGFENGVYGDFHNRRDLIKTITPENYLSTRSSAGKSASIDVTGGMQKKLEIMVRLISDHPDLSAQIFSGRYPGSVYQALMGAHPGTMICNQ